jgi:hypothetical protein
MPDTYGGQRQPLREVICPCGVSFKTRRVNQKFHSVPCQTAHYNKSLGCQSAYPGINTGTVGAISELRVSVDLLAKGYEVFRALSPACSCDLAILKDGKLLRIEVRTAYRSKNGGIVSNHSRFNADHFALVLPDEIVYEPQLQKPGWA